MAKAKKTATKPVDPRDDEIAALKAELAETQEALTAARERAHSLANQVQAQMGHSHFGKIDDLQPVA